MADLPSAADLYDLGDTSADPVLDSPVQSEAPPVAPVAGEAEASASQRPTPPRGEGGRFVKPEDAPPAHSRQTLRLARDLGISEEEIAGTSPEALDTAVYYANQALIRQGREMSRQAAMTGAQERQPAVQQTEAPKAPPLAPDFNEDDYDPGLMGVIKHLKQRLDRMEGLEAQRLGQDLTQQCDRAFARHASILGKGDYHAIKQGSPEMTRRAAVIALARSFEGADSVDAKIDRAVQILYGTAGAAAPAETATPQAEEWRRGGVARPTHRAPSAEPPGEQKAMRTAARILREAGGGDNGVDDYDAFPG